MISWVEGSGSDFKQKVRHYFIFFIIFLTIFAYFFIFFILGPFCTFYASLWSTPHHLWPHFVLSCLLSPTSPWTALQTEKINEFGIFFWKMTIFPFLAILTPVNPPVSQQTKHWGTSGVHLRVPTLPPDSTPSPNFRHHILFSPGGQFGTPHSHLRKDFFYHLVVNLCTFVIFLLIDLNRWDQHHLKDLFF